MCLVKIAQLMQHITLLTHAGWILSICFDAERRMSELVVLDAADVKSGPVATAYLPIVLPHGLHGTFVPENRM